MLNDTRHALVVAAHADDEALGCGGTIARLTAAGTRVSVLLMADGIGARHAERDAAAAAELKARRAAAEKAMKVLGAEMESFDFPDNKMDEVPILDVARRLEEVIARRKPDTVLTHFGGDLNVDHRMTLEAVATACRPQPGHCVRSILMFEVPSSTEWRVGAPSAFVPNLYVDISAHLDRKLESLRCYASEMRPWPHSRSLEAVEALAKWRGASVGVAAAEAFMVGRALVR